MKQKSKVLLVFAIVIAFVLMSLEPLVRASETQKNLYIVQTRENGTAYRINMTDANNNSNLTDVWKIIEKTNFNYNIYCIKGGPGFGSNDGDSNPVNSKTYTRRSDMKNVRETLATGFTSVLPKDEMVNNVKIKINGQYQNVQYNNYNAVLWLLDNMFLPKLPSLSGEISTEKSNEMITEMRENLLKGAFSAYFTGNPSFKEETGLTDEDIEVIQQLALWHFTNTKIASGEIHPKYDIVSYENDTDSTKKIVYTTETFNYGNSIADIIEIDDLFIKEKGASSYSSISDINRQTYAKILFTYLVENAMLHANDYGTGENRNLTAENIVSFDNSKISLYTIEGNTYVGPFNLQENNSGVAYTLTLPEVKNQDGKTINSYVIWTANEEGLLTQVATNETVTEDIMKTLIGKNVYISVAGSENIKGLSLSLNEKHFETSADFWMAEGSNAEQPVVMVDKKQVVKPISKSADSNFDLALRKFITAVNDKAVTDREPQVVILDNGKISYRHKKDEAPVSVENGDIVTYTLRIYNEGKVDGYAQLIKDDIPEYLEFLPENEINRQYGWSVLADGKTIITNYLQYNREDENHTNLIRAFDRNTMDTPMYKDIKVAFKVTAPNSYKNLVINTAEIADDADENGKPIDDIDSIPGNGNEEGKDQYHNFREDDIDKEYLKLKIFDLALRKFITGVNETVVDTRIPQVNIDENGKISYTHPKTPVAVHSGDKVIYTIRIYNEGETAGYADKITDFIPEGTAFIVDDPINIEYRWKLAADGISVSTDYLSYERDEEGNLLNAFGGTIDTLSYRDLKIAVIVTEPNNTTKNYLENIAEITEDKDKNGNPVDDIDSIPNNKDEDNRNPDGSFGEDDTDFERIKLETFDLALRKFIIAVNGTEIKDGNKYDREPNPVPVIDETTGKIVKFSYRHKKDESPVSVVNGDIVTYIIRVYNEGTTDGYAQMVFDDIPEGLEFLPENEVNKQYAWTQSADGKSVTTDYLSYEKAVGNIIRAFDSKTMQTPEYKDLKIVFKVTEPNNSTRMVVNTAEIAEDADKNGNPVDDIDSIPGNKNETGKDQYHNFKEDDIDKDYLVLKQFDLALRKFITAVNDKAVTDREPQIVILDSGKISYRHKKDEAPVSVVSGDVVTYTIRLYNEGTIDGYVQQTFDNIPEGLEFLPDNAINKQYGWKLSEDKKSVTTDFLSYEKSRDNIIKAFDRKTMQTPNYKDIKIAFKVTEPNNSTRMIVNTAEIAEDADENGNPVEDIDSIPGNKNETGKDEYHNFKEDDIDKDYIVLKNFDLALRKFITAVNEKAIDTRYPQPTMNENGRIIYIHPKDPILVANNDIVTYTIRVYNEGTIDGYAERIADDVPQGLEFLPDNAINKQYGWKLSEDGKTLTTTYLSKEKAVDNIIASFDKTKMQTPAYKDVKIAFKVTGENLPEDKILINTAEIDEDADKNGNPVDDIDSIPGNKNEEGKDENHNFKEDDIDKEYVKVHYFDLSLLKWVNKVITTVDGVTTERETGHTGLESPEPIVKEEINRKKINSTTVKFEYTIRITNEGDIAGYAKEISDYIPEGLKYVQEDNPEWKEVNGKITTRALENTLLQPGQTADVKVILTWINNSENMGVKINTAEISEDYNEYNVPDRDSTPNNKVPGEDDIDDAPVALSITTGGKQVVYFGLIGITLGAIIAGASLIKKYII